MRIMVLDIATTSGGGLTILEQYYQRAVNDCKNEWFFILGTPCSRVFVDTKNTSVYLFPKANSSFLSRFFFERNKVPQIVKDNRIQRVISMHGTTNNKIKCEQYIYLQQALIFGKYKGKLIKEPRIWFYTSILSRLRRKDVNRADRIIVQIPSTMKLCSEHYGISQAKFILDRPTAVCESNGFSNKLDSPLLFFYPTSSYSFRNVDVIIDASIQLNINGYHDYKVVLTIDSEDNATSRKWFKKIKTFNLPFEFVGYLNKEQMRDYYSKGILLFTSFVESFGLPLLEAKQFNATVIAPDLGYAHDVLERYDKAEFFNPNDPLELYHIMEKHIKCFFTVK